MSSQSLSDVEALVAQGLYMDAASLARDLGAPGRAAELYERIWEFSLAARCAREAGDGRRALANAIDARDERLIAEITGELDRQGDNGRRAAMETFASKRRFAPAAERAEALGELSLAVDYYRGAELDLDAARLLEAMGRDREAGRLLERVIERAEVANEAACARLRLGLLLVRHMSYELAARHLQDAARVEATRVPARRALIVCLVALGMRDAARDVLRDARADDPDMPADVDELVRSERERAAAGPAPSGDEAQTNDREQVIGGRYRLGMMLGAGSAGRVFQAHDEVSGRACALKLFHMAAARGSQAYERFVREARLAGALRHPNLIEVYDFSAEQGFLAMELLTGGSLAERLGHGALPAPVVRRLALDLVAGLELAHQRGVIHRDVKPANIFFDARGTAKLGDFGVAHLLDLGQTQTGGLIGTLAYMAPEQITGAPLTISADLYSLGITLFECITGRLPFLGPDFVAQHLGESAPEPSVVQPEAAVGWDSIIGRLLAKSPSDRYSSIDELRRDLGKLDLGAADRPKVLVLHRAGAAEPAAAGEPGSRGQPAVAAPLGPGEAEAAPRYQFETAIARTEISRLTRAVDTVLGRSVVIERYGEHAHGGAMAGAMPGAMDDAVERRLYALARGGGPFVQRALSYDKAVGVAVFEAPSGVPMGEAFVSQPLGARAAIRLLKRLARAVSPLHESGQAHGALGDRTVVVDDELNPTVLVTGLGPVVGSPTPRDDVMAIVELVAAAVRVPAPAGGGVSAPARLIAALLGGQAAGRAGATLGLEPGDPGDGDELYRLADALEIALLKAGRSVA